MATAAVVQKTRWNQETGEVLEQTTTVEARRTKESDEPEFVKLYVEQWLVTMAGKPSIMADVLVSLIHIGLTFAGAEGEGGMVVHATKFEKEAVAQQLGTTIGRVSNTITKLVQVGALKRLGRSVYQVNPSLIGKGNWKDIKALQVNWLFTADGLQNDTYATGAPLQRNGDE